MDLSSLMQFEDFSISSFFPAIYTFSRYISFLSQLAASAQSRIMDSKFKKGNSDLKIKSHPIDIKKGNL